jgi:hypothetical protein
VHCKTPLRNITTKKKKKKLWIFCLFWFFFSPSPPMTSIEPHPHQVAGHGALLRNRARGTVLKPLAAAELSAYRRAPAVLRDSFLPRLSGVTDAHGCSLPDGSVPGSQPPGDATVFLELEDLTAGMARPCLLDIKVGTRQHTAAMTERKIAYLTAKCAATTSAALGVRVTGIEVQ